MLKDRVLDILKENKNYVSGQSMCEQLDVSRTAVWKAVHRLRAEGYSIESVNNKGYKLNTKLEVYNEKELKDALKSIKCLDVHYKKVVDSTNIWAKEIAKDERVSLALCITDKQTSGRGRLGRRWMSSGNSGVWMSLMMRPHISVDRAAMITLIAALAVAEVIREHVSLKVDIKWPNDVLYKGRKLCGILTEMHSDMDGIRSLICGIGINVNTESFPVDISDIATSIYMETGKKYRRSSLIVPIIERMLIYIKQLESEADFSLFRERYENLLINKGREVQIVNSQEHYNGMAWGINSLGELIVDKDSGERVYIRSGEVSVRGVYRYK